MFDASENTILIYDVLEHLISYAYYLSYKFNGNKKCIEIVNTIKSIIINNPSFYYTPYDCHIRVVSMLYRLLDRVGNCDEVKVIMHNHCLCLMNWFQLCHCYPSPADNFEEVVRIRNQMYDGEYITSAFWGDMLRWVVLHNQKELFEDLNVFLNEDLQNVTKCTWMLDANEEDALYEKFAMHKSGEGLAFDASKYKKLSNDIKLVEKQYKKGTFSFDELGFESLEFIIAKYYGNFVRIKREHTMEKS